MELGKLRHSFYLKRKYLLVTFVVYLFGIIVYLGTCKAHIGYSDMYNLHDLNLTERHKDIVLQHGQYLSRVCEYVKNKLHEITAYLCKVSGAAHGAGKRILTAKCPFMKLFVLGVVCLPVLNVILAVIYFFFQSSNAKQSIARGEAIVLLAAGEPLQKENTKTQLITIAPTPPPRRKRKRPAPPAPQIPMSLPHMTSEPEPPPNDNYPPSRDSFAQIEMNSAANETRYNTLRRRLQQVLWDLQQEPTPPPSEPQTVSSYAKAEPIESCNSAPPNVLTERRLSLQPQPKKSKRRVVHAIFKRFSRSFNKQQRPPVRSERSFIHYCNDCDQAAMDYTMPKRKSFGFQLFCPVWDSRLRANETCRMSRSSSSSSGVSATSIMY